MIGRTELGHLSVGAIADVTALRLIESNFAFRDQADARARGKQRLQAELTLKDGKVVWDMNSLSGTDWEQLPPDYGIRPGLDHIVPPPDDMAFGLDPHHEAGPGRLSGSNRQPAAPRRTVAVTHDSRQGRSAAE
jgi:hypothetical protein